MITIALQDQGVGDLLARARRAGAEPEPLLRAAGTTLLSLTLGNFSAHGAEYRPAPWAPKRDGTPATLKRSGTLSSSFHLTVTRASALLANPMPYAAIHQFGGQTPPHRIVPRRKQALAWTAPGGGRIVARRVQHPGSRVPARPFVPITPAGELTPGAGLLVRKALERAWARQNPKAAS